ncbi:hypothetical protein VE23_24195 [Paenibacillus sp. D9]|nr:hypothetical protein VE23_24195 [Paenibacillus sp. D9]CDN44277.1 hypothetical protein BN871_EN_00150 [Paenibacillus sp. P22]
MPILLLPPSASGVSAHALPYSEYGRMVRQRQLSRSANLPVAGKTGCIYWEQEERLSVQESSFKEEAIQQHP